MNSDPQQTVLVVGPDGTHYELPRELAERFQRTQEASNQQQPTSLPVGVTVAGVATPPTALPPPSPNEPGSLALGENLKLLWSFRRFFVPFLIPALALLLFAFVQGDIQLGAALYQQRLLDSLIPAEQVTAGVRTGLPDASVTPAESPPASPSASDEGQMTLLVQLLPTLEKGDTLGLTLWLAGLLLFSIATSLVSEQASVVLNQKFRLKVQKAIASALARERKESRASRQSGATSTIFSSDAGGLSSLLIFGILGFLENLVKTVVYCVGLLFLQPGGWVVLAVMLPLSVIFQTGVLTLFHRAEAAATERSEKLMILMEGHLIRFFELLGRFVSFGSEARLSRQLLEMSQESAEANRRFQLISSLRNAISGLLLMLSFPITVFLLVAVHRQDGEPLSPGLVIQANMLVGLAMGGVAMLIMTPATLTHFGPSMRRVRAVLDLPEPASRPMELNALIAAPAPPKLDVENLAFHFTRNGVRVLHDISFSLPAGAVVGIVGPSGCGKSTMASILQGDLSPTSGNLIFDGLDITAWDLFWKRSIVGFMPTAFEFLNGTVRENILLGRSPEEAPNFDLAVETTGVLDFLRTASPPRDLDYQIESFTGEGYLSSGQRRRIGLAQALAGPQRLLILDEPGANLNPGDMVRLAEALPTALEGRTVILITHDPDVFLTDHIIFMLDGKIAAVGAHSQLMADNADYRRVVSRNREERSQVSTPQPIKTSSPAADPAPSPPPTPGSKDAYRQQGKLKTKN